MPLYRLKHKLVIDRTEVASAFYVVARTKRIASKLIPRHEKWDAGKPGAFGSLECMAPEEANFVMESMSLPVLSYLQSGCLVYVRDRWRTPGMTTWVQPEGKTGRTIPV